MSSYLVLARKYRPRTFEEVVGQEVVTRILQGALDEGRTGHAYLFAGPRGTGKTTLARILAKCLNCEQGPTSRPCGTCEPCRSADDGSAVDIIEMDAASRTGVADVRMLRDEVAYAPMRARHRVYIIDEVHMLSTPAFNALLKTLEEPPPHVVFLFATTVPHKLLDTVLSRCQVLRLQPLSEELIAKHLEDVFHKEGVQPGEGVVEDLARGARGGMRDALSMADRLLALSGQEPTLEDLRRLGGDGGVKAVHALLEMIEAGDRVGVLGSLDEFGGEETELIAGLLGHLRTGLVLATCGEASPLVRGEGEERTNAIELARRLGVERIELWMQELLRLRERLALHDGQERLLVEVTLLDLCRRENTVTLSELVERLEALQAGQPTGEARASTPAPGRPPASARPAAAPSPPPAPARTPPASDRSGPAASKNAPSARAMSADELWKAFLGELSEKHGALADLLHSKGSLEAGREGGWDVTLGGLGAAEQRLASDPRNQKACQRTLSRLAGGECEVRLVLPAERREPSERSESSRPAEPAKPKNRPAAPPDEFTGKVAGLFEGVIEDLQ